MKRVVTQYLAFSASWVLASDWVIDELIQQPTLRAIAQSSKGLAFVLASTSFLCWMIRQAERRQARLQAQTDQERIKLAHILNVSPAVTYALKWHDEHFEVDFVGQQIERIMGYAPQDWRNDLDFWRAHVHPDDQYLVNQAQQQLLDQHHLQYEYRFQHADGSYRWIRDSLVLTVDAKGRPEMAYGAWMDITQRRQAEEHLRLIDRVFDGSQEGIVVTDKHANILSTNRAFSQITGYSQQEVLGRNPSILRSTHQDRAFYEAMWASLLHDGRWEGEIWNRRKCGEVYPQWMTISAICDAHGTVQQYLCIFTETSVRKAAEERIQRLANYDTLTGLPNRTLLMDRATVAFATAQRCHDSVVLMHINLDHFGNVNESWGHAAGDEVLIEIARRLTRDLRPEDTVSRMGGDDFIVLIPDGSAHDIANIALRLMNGISQPLTIASQELRLSASIGIASYPDNGTDLLKLSQAAESAVHLAKKEGRNQFQFCSKGLQEKVTQILSMERELRHAVERQQLLLHYQPQVDIQSGQIIGLEALIRWQHPQWGMVSPGQFIPIAEESGLIREIGKWVMVQATWQNAQWHAQGLQIVPVAVNLSLAQFKDEGLRDNVLQALRESGLPAHMLELELTESVAMADSERTIATIASLKRLGVTLSIDDFGTGYSSLSYLKRYAVDKLKVDQSFVRGLNFDPHDEAIVCTVINLAKSMGLKTIAEGVETAEQLDFLRANGCDEFQGYFFSRPVAPDQLALMLRPIEELASA
ncbi:MAG: putative bifunctional diguanylate cyclase/phosphodiesterase [Acidobacteriota bacterium]